ncbi:DUF305 domain-containing protein, partial [Streptomyces albidoflavus]|uniref:DUF305 domain-containing protein n=1 Tax=Streptomyces albidoflavus TaxID=1886 RepID=UPI003D9F0ECF
SFLVRVRASSPPVLGVGVGLGGGLRRLIGAMEGWLTNNGGDGRAPEPHDHSAMAGMATEAQLKELRASRGKEFDQLFLTLMITHHQGAITMATEALSNGNNVLIEEMADDVIAQQTVEIGRMRTLLT